MFMMSVFRKFALILAAFMTAIAAPSHAAKLYLDNSLGDVKAEDKSNVATPQPVQVLFEFRTDGKPNARATKYAKTMVLDRLRASGQFSEVSETPVANGALLTVIVDNITQKDAAKKGFAVGLTFGLAGAQVTDFYNSSFEYAPASGTAPFRVDVRHAIHVTLGKKADESIGTAFKKMDDAFAAMLGQSMAHGLNNIARHANGQPAETSVGLAIPVAQAAQDAAPAATPAK